MKNVETISYQQYSILRYIFNIVHTFVVLFFFTTCAVSDGSIYITTSEIVFKLIIQIEKYWFPNYKSVILPSNVRRIITFITSVQIPSLVFHARTSRHSNRSIVYGIVNSNMTTPEFRKDIGTFLH